MGLDKAILYKKEHRKEYTGAKSISRQCRNHGSCPWCYSTRKYNFNKNNEKMTQRMNEYLSIINE